MAADTKSEGTSPISKADPSQYYSEGVGVTRGISSRFKLRPNKRPNTTLLDQRLWEVVPNTIEQTPEQDPAESTFSDSQFGARDIRVADLLALLDHFDVGLTEFMAEVPEFLVLEDSADIELATKLIADGLDGPVE